MNVGQFLNILIYISLPFQCTETSSLVYQGGPCVFHRVIEHNWYEKSSLIINDFVKLATSLKLEEQVDPSAVPPARDFTCPPNKENGEFIKKI